MLLSHLGEMTKISPAVLYQWNDTMHMLCHILVKCRDLRIWVKCCDLRALLYLAEMSRFTRFVAFGWNVAIYALCRILAEMSRFTRFARHKMSATRHLKLFCTPASRFLLRSPVSSAAPPSPSWWDPRAGGPLALPSDPWNSRDHFGRHLTVESQIDSEDNIKWNYWF